MPDFVGTGGDDTWYGSNGGETASGGEGKDYLSGGAGDDTINGDGGDDMLLGGPGNDIVNGGAGNDILVVRNDYFAGSDFSAGDQFAGGDGFDTLRFSGDVSYGFLGFDLTALSINSDIEAIDAVIPVILTFSQLTQFSSATGFFRVTGTGTLDLTGDHYFGGTIYMGDGDDTVTLAGNTLIGGWTHGGGGNDHLIGGENSDGQHGGDGADWLEGRGGGDTLNGAAGADRIEGGAGNDTLTGGTEADLFVLAPGGGSDIITDFTVGHDRIDLTAYGFASFNALLSNASQVWGDVVIQLVPGESLTLQGVDLSMLAPEDFVGWSGGVPIPGSIIPALPPEPTTTPITEMETVTTDGWEPYTVAAGTTIYATTLFAIFGSEGAGYMSPLTNNGFVWNDVPVDMDGNGNLLFTMAAIGAPNNVRGVENNGVMVLRLGRATQVNAFGFLESTVDNHGEIYIINEGTGNAWGMSSFLVGPTVNSGLVVVQAQHGIAFGYEFMNEAAFTNEAGAQLLVEGEGAIAFYCRFGSIYTPTQVTNAGTIVAHSLSPDQLSFGLYLDGMSSDEYEVSNSGTITADFAIFGGDDSGSVTGNVIQLVDNLASGEINGLVYLQRGNDGLENAGTVNGDVYMGDGADLVDTSTGVINGVTDMGWGADTYTGGASVDLVAGARGNDELNGGGGNDLLMGGAGEDVLTGGAGNDGLFGEWGNDRIVTAAGDFVDGGDGNDRIELGDYTFEYVSGGAGFDTLVLPGPAGVRTINLSSVLAEGAVAEIEQIELTGGKTVIIQASDVTALTGGETTLRLTTTLTDRVKLVGAWTNQGSQTIHGVVWKTYVSGGVTILVQGTGVVSTNATSEAGALDPFAGGELAPLPGEGPLGFTNPQEFVSNYELTQSETVAAGEIFVSPDGSPVFTAYGSGIVLTNHGLIASIREAGTTAGGAAFGVRAPNIDKVLNYGTIVIENFTMYGGAFAIESGDSSIVENHGLISAMAADSTAQAVRSGSFFNYGTVEAYAQAGTAFGFAAVGRTFENHGTISVHSDGASFGGMYGLGAAVGAWLREGDHINTGDIIASAAFGGSTAVAYDIGSSASLTNSGTMTAEIALFVRSEYSDSTFDFDNSGEVIGRIELGRTNDTVLNSGLIDGAINLGAGNDVFNGQAGVQTGPISGGDGNDQIIGGAGAETIGGNAGTDTLTGGAGADWFQDTAAGLGGDTITDFAAGDSIIITDASLAGFAFNLSGNTLTYTGGSLTLSAPPTGPIYATAAAGGGVQLSLTPPETNAVRNDFNGDGRSDILWRSDSGQFSDWLATPSGGFTMNDANAFTAVPTNWHITGTGDFNGDGFADVLWRSDSGQVSNWLGQANGGFTNNDANAFASVPTSWNIVGTGDFNGDHRDDILWRSDSGQLSNWLGTASGGFTNNDANAFAAVPTDWHVAGTGDFNGDGFDDILWRSDGGQLSNWLGNGAGGFTNNDANAFAAVPTSWHVAGTGDFNNDGFDDILWRSDSGQLSNWLGTASGGFTNNDANAFAFVPTSWQVVAVGDYNGDGFDDLLWRSDSGQLSNWMGTAGGGFTNNDANAFSTAPTSWHVQPEHDWI